LKRKGKKIFKNKVVFFLFFLTLNSLIIFFIFAFSSRMDCASGFYFE